MTSVNAVVPTVRSSGSQRTASYTSQKGKRRSSRRYRSSSRRSNSSWSCCDWEDYVLCGMSSWWQPALTASSTDDSERKRRESANFSAATNVAFGIEFEEAVRVALMEIIIDNSWPQTSVSAQAVPVQRNDGQTAGDIDAYIKLESDMTLKQLLPNGAKISEGTQRLASVIPAGTLILYEAKTTWNKARIGLHRKDACFELFWEKYGRPPVLVLFVHGGLQKRSSDKSFSQDGSTFEGAPCHFLTPTNTIIAWARSTDFYTWAPDLRSIRYRKTAADALHRITQLEAQINALTHAESSTRPRSWFSENQRSPSRPLLLFIAFLAAILIIPAHLLSWQHTPPFPFSRIPPIDHLIHTNFTPTFQRLQSQFLSSPSFSVDDKDMPLFTSYNRFDKDKQHPADSFIQQPMSVPNDQADHELPDLTSATEEEVEEEAIAIDDVDHDDDEDHDIKADPDATTSTSDKQETIIAFEDIMEDADDQEEDEFEEYVGNYVHHFPAAYNPASTIVYE